MARLRVGCTGWGYDDWLGGFYPRGTPAAEFLPRYARVFDLVEVDSSYYASPDRKLVARWAASVPEDFTFTLKFPGAISHEAKLDSVDEQVTEFLQAVDPLVEAKKLGPLLLQFPPSFRRDRHAARLDEFLARWPRSRPLAVELRDKSWWTQDTYRALEAANAALVWSVSETGRAPPVVTADFGYARLIGDRALTRFDRIQRDLTDEMRYWRERLLTEGAATREWYVFVNNHFMGHAPSTAARLLELLDLPAPDLGAAMRDGGQRSLFG